MINANDFKDNLEEMISDVEKKTTKWDARYRSLMNNLVAARRACERIIEDEELIAQQEKGGKEFFEATTSKVKKPIKIKMPK